ncbi:MAG TPA: FAD-dependent oxidoreductase [Anaerolineales bacterium]
MTTKTTDVLICGAGIAGIAAAYNLAVKGGVKDILLVDERAPMTLTSDKSTECYRNWWPGPDNAMVQLMNRSIDLLEVLAHESKNIFQLNRRGYLFLTADPIQARVFRRLGEQASHYGAGPLRIHNGHHNNANYIPAAPHGFESDLDGADLILDPELIRTQFSSLSKDTVAALHVRRAGWLSAQQLGMYMLEQARHHGVQLLRGRVKSVNTRGGKVQSVQLDNGSSLEVSTDVFVSAAGPLTKRVGEMLDVEIPVFSELHLKVACNDPLQVVPRDAPLLIWEDPQQLPFSEEERAFLEEDHETRWLLNEFPRGIHTKPEGGAGSQSILILWTYDTHPIQPVWPIPADPFYPEIVMRGLATMLPKMQAYFGRFPQPIVDGGYYTKTVENRPLVGPLPVKGAYLIDAFSGFGVMASAACGELLAAHVTGGKLPSYAQSFDLKRYQDPEYVKLLDSWGETGQL